MANDIENMLENLTSQRDKVLDLLGYGQHSDAEFSELRESRNELLAAARAIYQAVHGDTIAVGPLWGRLRAAITTAEEHES